MEVEIVKYQPDLKEQVLELQTHLWSSDLLLNKAYFEWKYEANPYVQPPLVYLALSGGKAVGMRGMLGALWQVGPAERLTGLYAEDLVIAPKYRNKGLIAKIMKAAFEDLSRQPYQFVFSLSAGPTTFLTSLTMGWRSIGSMDPMELNGDVRSRLSEIRRRASGLPFIWRYAHRMTFLDSFKKSQPFYWIDKAQYQKNRSGRTFIIEKQPDPEAMAGLVTRLGYDGRLRHIRDAEYFAWRFKNPLRQYRFIFFKNPLLEGYLVLQGYLPKLSFKARVNIVDWEAINAVVLKELLDTAIRYGHFEQLFTWSATLSSEKKAILAAAGFQSIQPTGGSTYSNCVIARPVRETMLENDWMILNHRILDLPSWDIRMIYSMHG